MNSTLPSFLAFLAIGAVTTFIDFAFYNLLAGRWRRWPAVRANVVSCTLAMAFSFFCNRRFAFNPGDHPLDAQAWRFVIVTLASSNGLQSATIWGLSRCCDIRSMIPLGAGFLSQAWAGVVERNSLKAAAVGVGLVWNFLWYRLWVFA
jgi:putative flippase GtrA